MNDPAAARAAAQKLLRDIERQIEVARAGLFEALDPPPTRQQGVSALTWTRELAILNSALAIATSTLAELPPVKA